MLAASGAGQRPFPLLVGLIGLIVAIYGVYQIAEADKALQEENLQEREEKLITAFERATLGDWQEQYQIAMRNNREKYFIIGCPPRARWDALLEESNLYEINCIELEMMIFKGGELDLLMKEVRENEEKSRRQGWWMIGGGLACFLINMMLMLVYFRFKKRDKAQF